MNIDSKELSMGYSDNPLPLPSEKAGQIEVELSMEYVPTPYILLEANINILLPHHEY